MKKIILDTNFLIYCVKYKIDFMEELKKILDFNFEVYTLNIVLMELEKLNENLALEIVKRKNLKILNVALNKKVDEVLVKLSDLGFIVATQDKGLKEKLKKPIIIIRQQKYLKLIY